MLYLYASYHPRIQNNTVAAFTVGPTILGVGESKEEQNTVDTLSSDRIDLGPCKNYQKYSTLVQAYYIKSM